MKSTLKQNKLKESKEAALSHMQALADVARESFLILDADLRVISANLVFYQNFCVEPAQTENVLLYELGNGQWNIPKLRELLEEILPEKKVVRDYEVKHTFQTIGEKTILLNAKQIKRSKLIILAMEDISVRKELEEKLATIAKKLEAYSAGLEVKGVERTEELFERVKELEKLNKSMIGRELKMVELKKEIAQLKKKRN